MAYNYCPNDLTALFKKQCEMANNEIFRFLERDADDEILRLFRDNGAVHPTDNSETIIWGNVNPGFIDYRQRDTPSPWEDYTPGIMAARSCDGSTVGLQVNGVNIPQNLSECSPRRCEINFGKGYKRIGAIDYRLDLATPVFCAENFRTFKPTEVVEWFTELRTNFTRFGIDNFRANLRRIAMEYAGANVSIIGTSFQVTSGGWIAPPDGVLNIWWLQRWHSHLQGLPRGNKVLSDNTRYNDMLEIRCPQHDWDTAVRKDIEMRHGGATLTLNYGQNPDNGAPFQEYGGIKWIRDEFPMRGYFNGTRFVEILRYKPTTEGLEAGAVSVKNDAYDQCYAWCNGQKVRVVTVIPMIDSTSFVRMGLTQPWRPATGGDPRASNNLTIKLVDGAHLSNGECDNSDNDKWRWQMKHEFRVKPVAPELTGYMIYLHDTPCGYTIQPCCTDECVPEIVEDWKGPMKYDQCAQTPSDCAQQTCDTCFGTDATDTEGGCGVAVSKIGLEPCGGTVETMYLPGATPNRLLFKVCRSGTSEGAIVVPYTLADVTAAAGTHYVDASVTPGTINFADGETGCKMIAIDIIGWSNDPDVDYNFTLTLGAPTPAGSAVVTCASTTVAISGCIAGTVPPCGAAVIAAPFAPVAP